MNIKTAAALSGLSAYTLRYYEDIGLLINIARNSSGHRDYSERDIVWIKFIQRLKATNMPLAKIRRFAVLRTKGDSTIKQRSEMLVEHRNVVCTQIEEMHRHLERIDEKIALCNKGGPLGDIKSA
ncbi:MAG: MerR family transcriptional regulator [Pseudomonadota bacterium]